MMVHGVDSKDMSRVAPTYQNRRNLEVNDSRKGASWWVYHSLPFYLPNLPPWYLGMGGNPDVYHCISLNATVNTVLLSCFLFWILENCGKLLKTRSVKLRLSSSIWTTRISTVWRPSPPTVSPAEAAKCHVWRFIDHPAHQRALLGWSEGPWEHIMSMNVDSMTSFQKTRLQRTLGHLGTLCNEILPSTTSTIHCCISRVFPMRVSNGFVWKEGTPIFDVHNISIYFKIMFPNLSQFKLKLNMVIWRYTPFSGTPQIMQRLSQAASTRARWSDPWTRTSSTPTVM